MSIRYHTFIFHIIIILCLPVYSATAFTGADENTIKAVLFQKLARYVEWPQETHINKPEKPFVIGVFGNGPMGELLKRIYEYSGHKINDKAVTIVFFSQPEQITITDVLFINKTDEETLEKVLMQLTGKPVLTISDTEGYGEKGVLVNFFVENEKVRFEINLPVFYEHGLSVDFRLRNIAHVIGGENGGR